MTQPAEHRTGWNGIERHAGLVPLNSRENMAAVLGQTLQLLVEVSDYLKRLPNVPLTHALIDQIDAHRLDPQTRTAQAIAQQLEIEAQTRVAGWYAPSGAPILEVEVHGDQVRLRTDRTLRAKSIPLLEDGCEMTLKPKAQFLAPSLK